MFRKEERATLGVSIVTVIFGWLIHGWVRKLVSKLYAPKKVSMDTPLSNLKGSLDADLTIKRGTEDTDNIAYMYEQMCALHPLRYENDPRVPVVLERYRKIVSGEEPDREGRHVPSEKLDGGANPDYLRYLINQRKVLGEPDWLMKEIKRTEEVVELDDIRSDYLVAMLDMGIPAEIAVGMIRDDRLDTFEPEDWQTFMRKVKGYVSRYPADVVYNFVANISDKETLFDEDKLDTFAVYQEHDAPISMSLEIVQGRITTDQAEKITRLVVEEDYPWDEAMEEVLQETINESKAEELRERYRDSVQ